MVESWKKRNTQQKAASKSDKKLARSSAGGPEDDASSQNDQHSLPLQQALLDIFRDACVVPLDVDLESTLQEVKGHLYNRDFIAAFGKDEYLQAYAARWSPSRALAYVQVFSDISCYTFPPKEDKVTPIRSPDQPRRSSDHASSSISRRRSHSVIEGDSGEVIALVSNLTERVKNVWRSSTKSSSSSEPSGSSGAVEPGADVDESSGTQADSSAKGSRVSMSEEPSFRGQADLPAKGGRISISAEEPVRHHKAPSEDRPISIACIGGGAGAEIVGLAGWIKSTVVSHGNGLESEHTPPSLHRLDVLNIDVAAWDKVVEALDHRLTSPPVLSKYASAAAKAANSAFLTSGAVNVRFRQQDVLEMESSEVASLVGNMDVVTIMYTLNELYTSSVPKAQRLLLELTACMQPGTHLLVVDSPGSYSTVMINGAEKRYPMQWLLDHTLLDEDRNAKTANWEKVVSDESRWFRIPKGLKYPIELENMRYQIHLYRRC